MKKIFFSLAAALFAATSFAQGIVLEHVFTEGLILPSSTNTTGMYGTLPNVQDFDECFAYVNNGILTWWDESYTTHTVNVGDYDAYDEGASIIAARNIFTNDNRLCFLCSKKMQDRSYAYRVIDEFGTIIADIYHPNLEARYAVAIYWIFGAYKLVFLADSHQYPEPTLGASKRIATEGVSSYTTYIYSLPGTGKTATSNEIVQSAPRRNRKYIQDAQVLVEEYDHTYNMTGALVK